MSERPTQVEIDEANASHTQDAVDTLQLMVDVCQRLNPNVCSPICSQGDYYTVTPQEIIEFASKLHEKDAATIAESHEAFALVKKLHIKAIEEVVQLRRDIETWNVYAKEREATIAQKDEEIASLKAQLAEAQNCAAMVDESQNLHLTNCEKCTIPEGWKLVPIEPDYQMCAAGLVACPVMGLSINAMPIIYKAMLSAAPGKD